MNVPVRTETFRGCTIEISHIGPRFGYPKPLREYTATITYQDGATQSLTAYTLKDIRTYYRRAIIKDCQPLQ